MPIKPFEAAFALATASLALGLIVSQSNKEEEPQVFPIATDEGKGEISVANGEVTIKGANDPAKIQSCSAFIKEQPITAREISKAATAAQIMKDQGRNGAETARAEINLAKTVLSAYRSAAKACESHVPAADMLAAGRAYTETEIVIQNLNMD